MKLKNYNVDLEQVKKDLAKLESMRDRNKLLIDKYQSLIAEREILKHMDEDNSIVSMIYMKDFTYEKTQRKLNVDETIQNELNTYGCDLVVEYKDRTELVDLKVISYKTKYYHENKKGKTYHGWKNKKYGVDNLVFQLYQNAKDKNSFVSDELNEDGTINDTKYGWGFSYQKNTSELYILVKDVGLYIIKYKPLVKLMKGYIHKGYDKHYFDMKKEIVISIPCEDMKELFENGTIKYIPMYQDRVIRSI